MVVYDPSMWHAFNRGHIRGADRLRWRRDEGAGGVGKEEGEEG